MNKSFTKKSLFQKNHHDTKTSNEIKIQIKPSPDNSPIYYNAKNGFYTKNGETTP